MNKQPISKLEHRSDGLLNVHSIFHTIQGEGIFSGHPATFLRLVGCNIRCSWCDTEYTDGTMGYMKPEQIAAKIQEGAAANKLVVISGGEPFRQELTPTILFLLLAGFRVQIETNGTLTPSKLFLTELAPYLNKRVFIMCSPKGRIHKDLHPHVSAYKYVLDHNEVNIENGLPARVLGFKGKPGYPPKDYDGPLFLQPMDSQCDETNKKHLDAVLRSCMAHGYTLCLQVHKIIDVE